MKLQLPVLPWGKSDLQPFLSSEAVECHYFGHHKAYIDKVNAMTQKLGLKDASLEKIVLNYDGALFDNAAQAWNHTFYWLGLQPRSSHPTADGELMKRIGKQFGSLEGLKERFAECGANLFGSGWTWLISNERGDIDVVNTHNADTPLRFDNARPLWVCDIWEHAYYVDYRNVRKEYLQGAWKHINWSFVEENLLAEQSPNMSQYMMVGVPDDSHPTPA